MAIKIIPDNIKPLPDDFESEEPTTLNEKVKVATNTMKVLVDAGAEVPISSSEKKTAEQIFTDVTNPDITAPLTAATNKALSVPATVQHLYAMLSDYDHQVVDEAVQLRRFVTNKLIEDAGLSDPRHRLKALELLGKISDVGLFSEKTEITVKNLSQTDLEAEIKAKMYKILGKTAVVDATFEVVPDEARDITPDI